MCTDTSATCAPAPHTSPLGISGGNALARGDKDRGAVLTGPDELVAIAQHFCAHGGGCRGPPRVRLL